MDRTNSLEQGSRPGDTDFIADLIGLSVFLETRDSIETSLRELATMVADLLRTENCSIMLLKEEPDAKDVKLRVFAHHGYLPESAYRESVRLNQGIAGTVAGTCKPLLIPDIGKSPFAGAARRDNPGGGFISAPIVVNDKAIGVLNLSNPRDARELDEEDLRLAGVVALTVGKSIQVFQLQGLLRSNFIQLALARETKGTPASALADITHNGARMAKILAKTFFRDMQDSGFGTDHILSAATEILSLLGSDLEQRRQQS